MSTMIPRWILLPVSISLVASIAAPSAEARFIENVSRQTRTSRSVRETAKYLRSLERRDIEQGIVRRRSTDPVSHTSGTRQLRSTSVRRLRRGKTDPGYAVRKRNFLSPIIRHDVVPSRISKQPVSVETEAFYRNGIKYFQGSDGVQKDVRFSYMWLNFALSDGHPLARDALRIVVRSMTQSQLVEAKERTKALSKRFLQYNDRRAEVIRDRSREEDMKEILFAVDRYWWAHQGSYPAILPSELTEICKVRSATCLGLIDLYPMIPQFILDIPSDPLAPTEGNGTGYEIMRDEDGVLVLTSKYSEFNFIVVTSEEE